MASRYGVKLLVRNLPWTIGTRELQEYFSQFGYVSFAKVIFDTNTGFSQGYGLVRFRDHSHADAVFRKNPHFLEGKNLEILPASND